MKPIRNFMVDDLPTALGRRTSVRPYEVSQLKLAELAKVADEVARGAIVAFNKGNRPLPDGTLVVVNGRREASLTKEYRDSLVKEFGAPTQADFDDARSNFAEFEIVLGAHSLNDQQIARVLIELRNDPSLLKDSLVVSPANFRYMVHDVRNGLSRPGVVEPLGHSVLTKPCGTTHIRRISLSNVLKNLRLGKGSIRVPRGHPLLERIHRSTQFTTGA